MKSFASITLGVTLVVSTQLANAQFTKVTTGPLVTDSGQKLTTAWADFDHDGKVDAFVPNVFANSSLYRNLGNGDFESLTNSPMTLDSGYSTAASWGDYDNDGNLDLFVLNRYQNHFLYRGLGGTNFESITNSPVLTGGPEAYSCSWVDYDNDGNLDLFVVNAFDVNYLYHNNGDGTFTRNEAAAITAATNYWGNSAWGDFNNDGRMDVFMTGWNFTSDALFRNDGNGVFTSVGSGDMVSAAVGATSASWADYDNDGDLDLFVANRDGVNFLYRNDGGAGFTKITSGDIVTDVADSNAGVWGDYDNDGWLDLFVANGDTPANQTNFLYHNNGDGTFTKVTSGAIATDSELSTSPVWVDYDNDGHLDLFLASGAGVNSLFHNDGNNNHWLKVRLVGTRSNRSAIGAKIRVTTDANGTVLNQMRQVSGDAGFVSQNLESHFGLGAATIVASLRVEWPSGLVTTMSNIQGDQTLTISEGTSSIIVIPSSYADKPALGYSGDLSQLIRSQQVYPASSFPAHPFLITGLHWRRYNSQTFTNETGQFKFRLSTTSRTENDLSGTFADNIGPDETVVFDGNWTVSSITSGNTPPYPFEMVLNFTNPFLYDPSQGNLLIDHQCFSTTIPRVDGVGDSGDGIARAYNLNLDPYGTTASVVDTGGDILEFEIADATTGPLFVPTAGVFTNSVQVTIQSPVGSGTIHYTTDGSDPTETSTVYTGAFALTQTTTVKARLYVNGFPASDIVEATYTLYVPPDIQFVPPGRLFTNQISVSLVNNVGAGTIRYTTDGSAPTSSSTTYGSAIDLTVGATIQAQVYVNSFPVSDVFSETYSRVYVFESDGIPFAWLEQYFGPNFLTDPDAAANADSDHDGYTNREEYENNTVPTDASSAPQIVLSVRAVPRLTFTTLPGRSYRIDRTTMLNPPDWRTIVESVTADGTELHYVDEEAPDNSYYRIELIGP